MGVLKNPKHELFAQELAKGKTATEAYELAGYRPSRANASHLQRDHNISQRVVELLAEREQIHSQATAEAVERAGLTKEWIIAKLIENAERASQAEPVRDSKGNETGEYRYEGNVVNRSLELLGKELGMFIDRSEDVTARRTAEQIYTRLHQVIADANAAGSGGPDRGAGPGSAGDEAIPTVPGHGTA